MRAGKGRDSMAVILTEGRAASGGRREVHAPGSATWPADGIVIRLGHGKPAEIRNVIPARATTGAVQVAARATDAIKRAVSAGAKYASIEFLPLKEADDKRRGSGGAAVPGPGRGSGFKSRV